MTRSKPNRNIPPLDSATLERLALRYVERYATTRFRLTRYLERKLYERGWAADTPAPIGAIVERFAQRGYVDDKQFAEMQTASLSRRGFGKHRINSALRAAGIAAEDSAPAREAAEERAWEAALRFARRRRIGPYATEKMDADANRRAFLAMIRAGHPVDLVQKILHANTNENFAVFGPDSELS